MRFLVVTTALVCIGSSALASPEPNAASPPHENADTSASHQGSPGADAIEDGRPPQSPIGLSRQQQSSEQQGNGNGRAQKAAGSNGNTPTNGAAAVDPGEAPHQSGGAQQGSHNGQGESPNHGADKTPSTRFLEKIFEDPVAFFTVWVAIFTAVLAVATIGLWRQTRRLAQQALDAAGDNRRLIEATERTADAAATNARIATKSFERGRAILMFDNLTVDEKPNVVVDGKLEDFALIINVRWKNSGVLPATKAAFTTRHMVVPINAELPNFDVPPVPRDKATALLASGQQAGGKRIVLAGQELRGFYARRDAIVIYGVTMYSHDLGDGEAKKTEFCGRLTFNGHEVDQKTGARRVDTYFAIEGSQNSIS